MARRRGAAVPDPHDHDDQDDEPVDLISDDDEVDYYDDEGEDQADEPARRGGLLARWTQSIRRPLSGSVAVDESDLKPTEMRGNEARYGYILAAELIIVAILNLTFTHGKNAPAHPPTTLSAIGLVISVGFGALIRTHNRFIVSFAALIAAFFVTLPRIPESLFIYHVFALIFPLIYALVLMQRQRRATLATTKAKGRQTPEQRRADLDARRRERRSRRRGEVPAPGRVAANRRYTPPKAKRPRR